jgi:hypothetical protein
MDYDFRINQEALRIPSTAYQPIKRCQFCQSVFITDKACESCGRSMTYHLIGEPFGVKSYYGIKERYVESLNIADRFFPVLENKKSPLAKSYVRKLEKRFSDLISAFNTSGIIAEDHGKLFYVETIELVDELLRYDIHPSIFQALLLENDSSSEGQKLLFYLENQGISKKTEEAWPELFLNYRLWGVLRVDYFLKIFLITTSILTMAVMYKDIISSQFGK